MIALDAFPSGTHVPHMPPVDPASAFQDEEGATRYAWALPCVDVTPACRSCKNPMARFASGGFACMGCPPKCDHCATPMTRDPFGAVKCHDCGWEPTEGDEPQEGHPSVYHEGLLTVEDLEALGYGV